MDYNAFKTRCKEKGYSPSSLVADLGLSKSNVTNWKHGGNPSYAVLIQISQKLECTVGFLLGEEHSDNGVGAVVSQELWENELTSARTISLEVGSPLKDEYLNEIAVFANCSILFLCGYEKKFVERQSCRTTANISERGWDKLLAIFDNVNNNPIIANMQMQLSRIVLHNLGICSGEQIPDEFLCCKADFIGSFANVGVVKSICKQVQTAAYQGSNHGISATGGFTSHGYSCRNRVSFVN